MAPFFLYLHYVLPLVRQKSFKVSKEAKVWAHAFSPQIECKEEAHTHTHTHRHTHTQTHTHTDTHTHTHMEFSPGKRRPVFIWKKIIFAGHF